MHAAVHGKYMTRDVTPHIGDKKINGIGDVFGNPEPVYRYLLQKLLTDAFRKNAGHVGFNKAGSHGINRYVPFRVFPGDSLGKPDDTRLACAVVCLSGIAHFTDHRADVDDSTAFRLGHEFYRFSGTSKGSRQVYVDDVVPVLVLHPHQQTVTCDPGIVYENVECAEFIRNRTEKAFNILPYADVDRTGNSSSSQQCNLVRGFFLPAPGRWRLR